MEGKKPQVPPLRCAPVPRQAGAGGMTIHLHNLQRSCGWEWKSVIAKTECHPDRSEAQWRDPFDVAQGRLCGFFYNEAMAVASSRCRAAYLVMPTMVKTFWKCGVSPNAAIVWSALLASINIWMTRAIPLELM